MSFLNNFIPRETDVCSSEMDNRWKRNMQDDIKTGIDHLFALKTELAKLHPLAHEALMILLSR